MEFLIATAVMTCTDVSDMVQKVQMNRTISSAMKQEIVEMYEVHFTEALDIECSWDAKADWRNGD